MPAAGPGPLLHQGDSVVALFQILHRLVKGRGLGVVVGVHPVQLPALDTVGRKLRGKVGVIGAVAQGLVPVVHGPFAGVLRRDVLPRQGGQQHGRCGRAAPAVPDGGVLPLHPVGLAGPPLVRLEKGNRLLVHLGSSFRRLLGGKLVIVDLPILRPLLLHRVPLVGGPLKLEQDHVRCGLDIGCRHQHIMHELVTLAQLMDQKSKLCLQVPHGLPRCLGKGQQRRLAGVVGPLGQPIPGPVLGKVGIGPAVHRRRVGGVRISQLLFVGVLEVGRNQPAFRVEITHQPRRSAGRHARRRQVVPDSFLIGFSGQHL